MVAVAEEVSCACEGCAAESLFTDLDKYGDGLSVLES